MRKVIFGVFFSLVVAFSAHAEIKIGYVNTARVVNEAPQMQEIRSKLEAEFKDEKLALESKQNDIQELQKKAGTQGQGMSDAERKKLQEEFLQLRDEFTAMLQEYREKISQRQKEEFSRFDTVIRREIQKLAQQGDYDIILTDGVAFAKPEIDVTDKILTRIKSASQDASK